MRPEPWGYKRVVYQLWQNCAEGYYRWRAGDKEIGPFFSTYTEAIDYGGAQLLRDVKEAEDALVKEPAQGS
jgi:hypothetical protein